MNVLYEHAERDLLDRLRFNAILHGVNLDQPTGQKPSRQVDQSPIEKAQSDFVFKDPAEYDKMTLEERKVLTRKMMGMHKRWHQGAPLGGR